MFKKERKKMLEEKFSKNLVHLRKEFGLTQKEVAKGIGTSQQSYCKYESGSTSPTLRTVEKLLKFFKVGLEDLFG